MRKIAFIGTGGTLSSLGDDSLDILDYGRHERRLDAPAIAAAVPELARVADVRAVAFRAVESSAMDFSVWHELATLCTGLARDPDLAGIVIGHGTATLEETAYALDLTLKLSIPVVMVGSQRPLSGLSSDAHANLLGAVRVAADPASRGRGVLVVLNDEIQAARDVAKTSTARLQTFRTPDFGILGQVDGPHVRYYRRSERRHMPDTEFDVAALAAVPRVDIVLSYAGADGTAARALRRGRRAGPRAGRLRARHVDGGGVRRPARRGSGRRGRRAWRRGSAAASPSTASGCAPAAWSAPTTSAPGRPASCSPWR